MISSKPAPAATKPKLAACAAALLLLGACASFARVPSQQVASSAAADSATPSAPIYRQCDGQNVKETALAACNVAAGEYKNQMSEHGCDWTKFFTYGCWECCGVIAPYPPSPPPPSPPLLANKWANAGLNTGITFAKFGAGTAFTFGTSNPFTTDYGKLGQQTGESFSEQGMKEAHGYVTLDDTGIAKTAATPGLNAFEQGIKYGNHKAAQAVGNEAAPTPVISGAAAASSGAAAAASSGAAPVAR